MRAKWQSNDYKRVNLFRSQSNTFDDNGRSFVARQDTIRQADGRWLIRDLISYSNGAGWHMQKETPWVYNFAPIFHVKNLPAPNQFYGTPDLTLGVLRLNYYLNRIDSLIGRIIRIHAHPKTVAIGIEKDDLEINSEGILFLPDKEMELKNIEMTSDLAAADRFAERLRRKLAEVSHVPEITTGKVENVGVLSGRAMRMQYAPLLDLTFKKQLLYGRMITQIVSALLTIGGKGNLANQINLIWGDPLPADEKEQAEIAVMKKQIGYSDDTLITQTGGNPETERSQRTRQATEYGTGIVRAFDSGAEDDVYRTPDGRTPADIKALVDAAGALIRAGFQPEGALQTVGLDPITHLGLLPVTLRDQTAIENADV
jgi:hypothetical protein